MGIWSRVVADGWGFVLRLARGGVIDRVCMAPLRKEMLCLILCFCIAGSCCLEWNVLSDFNIFGNYMGSYSLCRYFLRLAVGFSIVNITINF